MALSNTTNVSNSSSQSTGPVSSKSHAGRGVGILIVCVAIAVAVVWRLRVHNAEGDKKAGGLARGAMGPVPVVAGVVAAKDVPIYLEGLGTVQAFNTVTVRARVDGQLVKVGFEEGQDVRAGDVLAEIDPAPFRAALEQALAKQGQDQAQLDNARVDLKRYADLLANEGVTQQVYDTQKSLVNQLEAGVKADQAAVENTRVQLGYTTITSPIDGRVGLRLVDQGNMVHANDTTGLVVITQLKPISVVFTLPEQNLGKIQAQRTADGLPVLAVQGDNATVLGEGKLTVIDNQIDISTGTIKLKATFPNADLRLWPGQFVNARLRLSVRTNSAVVPTSVVQRGPEGAYAFVIKEDQSVDFRPVKVAQMEQGEALIEEGLNPGERVVVDGQYKLQKGSRIKTLDEEGPRAGKSAGAPRAERTAKPAGAGSESGGSRGPRSAKP